MHAYCVIVNLKMLSPTLIVIVLTLSYCSSGLVAARKRSSNADVEAYLDVESILASAGTSNESKKQHQLWTDAMRTALETRRVIQSAPEDSRSGEIRGISSQLMQRLMTLSNEAKMGKFDSVSKECELIGAKVGSIDQQIDVKLSNLDQYLATLIGLAGAKAGGTRGDKGQQQQEAMEMKDTDRNGWHSRLLDWIPFS